MITQKHLAVITWLLLCVLISPATYAQRPSSPKTSICVDEVSPKSGGKMYGVIIDRNSVRLTMVVDRDWFKTTYPKEYARHLRGEQRNLADSNRLTLERLNQWEKDRADDERVVEFIQEERNRIQANLTKNGTVDPEQSRFTIVKFPLDKIKDVYVQPGKRRQIAGVAWKHKLDRVTVRTAASLERELKSKSIDIENEWVDLSQEIIESDVQSSESWKARVALFEYVLRSPLNYQGVGTRLFRTTGPNAAKPSDLLGGMLGGQGGGLGDLGGLDLGGLQNLLGGLEDGKSINDILDGLEGRNRNPNNAQKQWWTKATSEAEKEGYRGVKVTRLIQNLASPTVSVETHFFAFMEPGKWKPIKVVTATANTADQDPADLERIQGDPQVKKIFDMMNGLGLGGQNNGLLDKALRQGAATEKAMQESERLFNEFIDRYTVNTQTPSLGQ